MHHRGCCRPIRPSTSSDSRLAGMARPLIHVTTIVRPAFQTPATIFHALPTTAAQSTPRNPQCPTTPPTAQHHSPRHAPPQKNGPPARRHHGPSRHLHMASHRRVFYKEPCLSCILAERNRDNPNIWKGRQNPTLTPLRQPPPFPPKTKTPRPTAPSLSDPSTITITSAQSSTPPV